LYLGTNYEGESGPLHWWSFAVPDGGVGRPEPALDGEATAWGAGIQAVAGSDGRVVVSGSDGTRLVAEERPVGCERSTDPDLADMPVAVGLAGNQPVVTYWCGDETEPFTRVLDGEGGDAIELPGASLLAAEEGYVLLVSAPNGNASPGGIYLLDLDRGTLGRIGPEVHDAQFAMAGGLVLWNQPGPSDAKDVYDVVWNVARVPVSG